MNAKEGTWRRAWVWGAGLAAPAASVFAQDVAEGGEGGGSLLESVTLSEAMMIAGVALMTMLLLSSLRRRRARGAADPDPRERIERTRQTQAMRDDLTAMMVELEELSRRFAAQLDAKSIELERLIDDAEGVIERMRCMREEAGGAAASSAGKLSVSAAAAGAGGGDGPRSRAPRAMGASGVHDQTDPMAAKVYEMADGGSSPMEIAQGLNEEIGKVELILALRQG